MNRSRRRVALTDTRPLRRLIVSGRNSDAILVKLIDHSAGISIAASVHSGARSPPTSAPGTVVAPAMSVIPAPEAALASARAQSVVALQRNLGTAHTPKGTAVSLLGDVLFDFDRDRLRPDAQRGLAELAVLITRTRPRGPEIVE